MSLKRGSILPIPIGIVGSGGIAQLIHLPILKKMQDIKLAAICDVDTRKAAVVADKFGIPGVYEDVEEMLDSEELEAVFILTPNSLHLPVGLMALEHGLNLFVEKPAACSSEEARRLEEKAKSVGRSVMIGMQNRFRPDVVALKKFIDNREFGKIFFIKGGWLQARHQVLKQQWLFQRNVSGGGVVMDLGIQLIDLAWWLLGKPQPQSVKSFTYKVNKDIPVEDFCVSCLTFDNGVALSLEVSWDFPIAKDRQYLEITGENTTALLNPLKIQKFWHGQIINISPETGESKISNFKRGYENEVHHFVNFLLGRTAKLESPVQDAVTVLKMVEMSYQSIEQRAEIRNF